MIRESMPRATTRWLGAGFPRDKRSVCAEIMLKQNGSCGSLISALPITSKRAMIRIALRSIILAALLASMLAGLPISWAEAQTAADGRLQISWEVRNRFRLFREERDFALHVEAARGRSVLGSEQVLELQSDGRGWARNTVNRLCIDLAGRVNEPCTRDNVRESYLTPVDHPVVVGLTGPVPVGATCAWTFDDGEGPQASTFDCAEPVNFRARYGRTTIATVEVSSAEGSQRLATEIAVRDIFIAGLGDS